MVCFVASNEELQVQCNCCITAEYHVELCDTVLQLLVRVGLQIRIDIQNEAFSIRKAANKKHYLHLLKTDAKPYAKMI